ncbi:MAG: RtcB family protein, partial [Dysgonamonadaceae bacterium]|nr:RtcB family protein [Dysgonamonadaceae bacterium]
MKLTPKELTALGYTDNIARSIAVDITGKRCKRDSKEQTLATLASLLENPEPYRNDPVWNKLAARLLSSTEGNAIFDLRENPLPFTIYGSEGIEDAAMQQMELAMRLPVTVNGALMAD